MHRGEYEEPVLIPARPGELCRLMEVLPCVADSDCWQHVCQDRLSRLRGYMSACETLFQCGYLFVEMAVVAGAGMMFVDSFTQSPTVFSGTVIGSPSAAFEERCPC